MPPAFGSAVTALAGGGGMRLWGGVLPPF